MSKLINWLDHRMEVVGFENWMDLLEFSGLSLQSLREVQAQGRMDSVNRSDRRMFSSALRVSLRRLEQLDEGIIEWIEDDYFYDSGSQSRPRPGLDDDPSYWSPKNTSPEERGTPLIGRIRENGKAESDEDWQEEWGRHIPQRFGKGHDIYGLEMASSAQSVVLRNIPVWEFREGLAAIYSWNGWEAEGWFGRIFVTSLTARVLTADEVTHDLDLQSVVRIGKVIGRWPIDLVAKGE